MKSKFDFWNVDDEVTIRILVERPIRVEPTPQPIDCPLCNAGHKPISKAKNR
jgi:hypothetical protein